MFRIFLPSTFVPILHIFQDNADTWSLEVGAERKKNRVRAALWYYLIPSIPAALFLLIQSPLGNPGPLLSGLAIFTAFLFGLLFMVFNLGVTVRKDGEVFKNTDEIKQLINDLRANITYTAVVAVALVVSLVTALATAKDAFSIHWGWTPIVVWLGVHLFLNLATIMKRLRTTFNYFVR